MRLRQSLLKLVQTTAVPEEILQLKEQVSFPRLNEILGRYLGQARIQPLIIHNRLVFISVCSFFPTRITVVQLNRASSIDTLANPLDFFTGNITAYYILWVLQSLFYKTSI